MELYNGDCLEIMKNLPDNSIDIIIADLPYGRFKHLEWDIKIDFEKLWEQIWRVSKPTTPVFLFGDFKFAMEIYNSQPKYFKYEIVWNKGITTTPLLSRKRFGKATEYILVFYKKQPVYNYAKYHKIIEENQVCSSMVMGKNNNMYHSKSGKYEPRLPLNVFTCNIKKTKKTIKNLTEKPQAILEHLLKYFSNEGDTCLDFCMGSGSMGVACKSLNRKFIGIEKNKEFFMMTKERLNSL